MKFFYSLSEFLFMLFSALKNFPPHNPDVRNRKKKHPGREIK
jgi:hypothetical protein